jgi:SulP family sulfate permease
MSNSTLPTNGLTTSSFPLVDDDDDGFDSADESSASSSATSANTAERWQTAEYARRKRATEAEDAIPAALNDRSSLGNGGTAAFLHSHHVDWAHAKLFMRHYAASLTPPPFKWWRYVTWHTLRGDVIAALTVFCMLIPQSVAYAQLAGVSAAYGFYSASVPAIVYAFFGTSHCAAIGAVALSSLLTQAAVASLKLSDLSQIEAATVSLSCLIGILQLGAGLCRLGVVARFLSRPVLAGFTTGGGISIIGTQLKQLFGVKIATNQTQTGAVFVTIYEVCAALGDANVPAIIISIVSVAFLLAVRFGKQRVRWLKFFPEQLFLIIVGTVVSHLADLNARYGTAVVGTLPAAFPLPTVPDSQYMAPLFIDAILLSLIGFTESFSVSTTFADGAIYREACPLDSSQELVALGVCKVVGSFFSCIPVTGSLSRTSVAAATGSQTPLYGFIVGVLALASGYVATLLAPLPQAILAATISVACISLLKFKDLARLWHVDRFDFVLMLVTIIATLVAGISLGLLISVFASLVMVIFQASTAHHARLGLVPGTTETFRDVTRFRTALEVPHVLILRYDARLFFANAQHFIDMVFKEVRMAPGTRAVVLDFAAVNTLDSTALELVREMVKKLESDQYNVRIIMADTKGAVRDKFDAGGFNSSDRHYFHTTVRGSLMYLVEEGVLERDHLEHVLNNDRFDVAPNVDLVAGMKAS